MNKNTWYTLLILYTLATLNAHKQLIRVSTKKLGELLGVSQQTASRKLKELEAQGFIRRHVTVRGTYITLTERGIDVLRDTYTKLGKILEGVKEEEKVVKLRGIVFTGMREGAYYIRVPYYNKAFRNLLGDEPYPGTLNIRLVDERYIKARERLETSSGFFISRFDNGRRTYGYVKCFKAKIKDVPCLVLLIERTHYGKDVIEVVSSHNLRKVLNLNDGDEVEIYVYLE